jgi:hypothetical protein
MFFVGALYSITQLPKNLYMYGIKNCNEGLAIPLANSNTNNIPVKYEKMPLVLSTINKRLDTTIPSATEDFREQIADVLEPLLKEEAWTEKRCSVIVINGFDAQTKKSVCIIYKLTNDNNLFGKGFMLSLDSYTAAFDGTKTFFTITTFEFLDNVISNVNEIALDEEITMEMIESVVPSIAPFFFGSTIATEAYLAKPAIELINENLAEVAAIGKFVDGDEAKNAIAKWLKDGKVDFDEIVMRARKVCLTTPTPLPTASPRPTIEKEEDSSEDEIKSYIDKAAEFFEKLRKRKKNRPHRKQK